MTHFMEMSFYLAYCSKSSSQTECWYLWQDPWGIIMMATVHFQTPYVLHSSGRKFRGSASLTLWIMSWQRLCVLVLLPLVKSHSCRSNLHLFTHTLPNRHLDLMLGCHWPPNICPHFLIYVVSDVTLSLKLWLHVYDDCIVFLSAVNATDKT